MSNCDFYQIRPNKFKKILKKIVRKFTKTAMKIYVNELINMMNAKIKTRERLPVRCPNILTVHAVKNTLVKESLCKYKHQKAKNVHILPVQSFNGNKECRKGVNLSVWHKMFKSTVSHPCDGPTEANLPDCTHPLDGLCSSPGVSRRPVLTWLYCCLLTLQLLAMAPGEMHKK